MRVSSYRLRKQSQQLLWAILRTLLILGIAFVILHPLIEKLSMSFKAEIDMYDPTVDLIPKHFTLNNYVEMIDVMEYGSTLLCTLLLCSGTALLTTLSTTMAGYGFAKFPFKLNRLLFACVLVCMVVPPQTIMMSQFLNMRFFSFFGLTNLFGFKGFDLTNSPASLFLLSAFCSGIKNAFFIFIMRQYFKGVPNELYEAAAIDGAGQLKIFVKIMLPAAMTMMVTVFLFMFVWQYNDSYYTNMLVGNFKTMTSELSRAASDFRLGIFLNSIIPTNSGVKADMLKVTGEILAILPLMVVYLFGQKFLLEGVERSGLVG